MLVTWTLPIHSLDWIPVTLSLWSISFVPLHPGLSLLPSNEKPFIQPELMHSETNVPLTPTML